MVKQFANSGDPDQMPHSLAFDLGLQCLPIALIGVSILQWVNTGNSFQNYCSVLQEKMHTVYVFLYIQS